MNCYFIRDLVLVEHDTPFIGGAMAVCTEMMPAYRAHLVQGDHSGLVADRLRLPCRTIDGPCFPLAADGNVYGHFLIEALARLHVVARLLRPVLPAYRILVIRGLPAWVRRIMSDVYQVQQSDLVEYDPEGERVLLPQAIWPSLPMSGDQFHPYMNLVIADLLANLSVGAGLHIERVFLSRMLFHNPVMHQRTFGNEQELAEIAVGEYGFCPIAPETIPWVEQVRLFANARAIIGRFGSGLHNALFARSGTQVGVLGFGNLVQSGISALRSQRLAYVTAGNDAVPFIVPPDLFRRLADAVLAPRPGP
jgi:capsular polysaccharide biosynthesis protein